MKMSEFVSDFVKKCQGNIYILESKKCDESSDLLVTLEGRITAREINNLNRTHLTSNADVTAVSLKPFIEFLANRRVRILDTEADFAPDSTSNTEANSLCEKLASAIARKILDRQVVTKEEANEYLTRGIVSNLVLENEARQQLLRQRVAACIRQLFDGQEDLINFMKSNIQKSNWQEFIKCCNLSSLKDFFLPPEFIKKQGSIYNAATAKANDEKFYTDDDDMNDAKLFCLLEIVKRQRDIDPEYLSPLGGIFGKFTGIRSGRRVSQLQRLQNFLVSDASDLFQYMKQFKDDEKSMMSGHTKIFVIRTEKVRADRVKRNSTSMLENSTLPRSAAGT